jgi:CheY-like chemotaxis protein
MRQRRWAGWEPPCHPRSRAQIEVCPALPGATDLAPDLPKPRIVAVFNTNPEVMELVRESLEGSGYATVIAHVDDLKRGRIDMVQFVEEKQPDVIVYDVAPPYDTNWTFLRLMRNSKVMANRAFVITTTNKKALDELIGPSDVVELLCKPYDLDQIVQAVNAAFENNRLRVANGE